MCLKISKMSGTQKISCCLIYSPHKKSKKIISFSKKKKKNPLNSNKMKKKINLWTLEFVCCVVVRKLWRDALCITWCTVPSRVRRGALSPLLLSLNEAVRSINVKVTHIRMTDFCYFNRVLHRREALVFQSKTFLLMDTKILKLNIITR